MASVPQSPTPPLDVARPHGLTEAEAQQRLAARGEVEPPATSRSVASIVRANVFTVFNLILLVLGVLMLIFGNWRDALFLGILVINSGIGIAQELRAKRALDKLAALVAPRATVVRDGKAREAAVEEVVVDDLIRLRAGDQVVADGIVVNADGLLLDESILTGESEPVPRRPGEEVRSGSFVVEGGATFVVTAVGEDSYAERLTSEAREFRHPRSPLEHALDRLLIILTAAMVPLAALLIFSLYRREVSLNEAVETAGAGVVTIIPEGLILLASVTYAVAALRMAQRGALAQQLNAVESLAACEVICLDKTGTLTEAALRVVGLVPAPGRDEARLAATLARYAASASDRNLTLQAVADAYPTDPATPTGEVPFSSRRRWSALELEGTTYVLGAPELFDLGPLAVRARAEAEDGRRVLAIGATGASLRGHDPDRGLPPGINVLGLLLVGERLRPQTRETIAFFREQGVELKVLSGDAPDTVAAIARDAGIPASRGPADGRQLPEDPAALQELALNTSVIGRISPEGKRKVIESLNAAGKYTAMVGDGVNDVLALKTARLAIAQGSGAQMAKSVADVVLVKGDFAAVPAMVAEGRKLLRNLMRVTKLFVSKSSFAALLILTIGTTPAAFPFLPRHLTLAAALTVGIPGFFLALAPSSGPWRTKGFLSDVIRFSLPAGVAGGLGVVASYQFALNILDYEVLDARTVATIVLVLFGLYLILVLEAAGGWRGVAVWTLCGVLFGLLLLALYLPGTQEFFDVEPPDVGMAVVALLGAGLSIGGLVAIGILPGQPVPSYGAPAASEPPVDASAPPAPASTPHEPYHAPAAPRAPPAAPAQAPGGNATREAPTTRLPDDAAPTTALAGDAAPTTSLPDDAAPTTALPDDAAPTTALPDDAAPTTALPDDDAATMRLPERPDDGEGTNPTMQMPPQTPPKKRRWRRSGR